MAAAMSRRSSGPATRVPSRWSRNSTSVTPTTAADPRPSSSRSGPAPSGGGAARPPLLVPPPRPRLLRRDAGHPGLAARGQQVVHLLAGGGPRGDGGRDAVLD